MYSNSDVLIEAATLITSNEGCSIRCIIDNPSSWYSGMTITDHDGNTYHTIQIGTQIWMAENLAVKHYRNGDIIPEETNNTTWQNLTLGALCAYNNDWSDAYK